MIDQIPKNLLEFVNKIQSDKKLTDTFHNLSSLEEKYKYAVSIQEGYSEKDFKRFLPEIEKILKYNITLDNDNLKAAAGGKPENCVLKSVDTAQNTTEIYNAGETFGSFFHLLLDKILGRR